MAQSAEDLDRMLDQYEHAAGVVFYTRTKADGQKVFDLREKIRAFLLPADDRLAGLESRIAQLEQRQPVVVVQPAPQPLWPCQPQPIGPWWGVQPPPGPVFRVDCSASSAG